MLGKVFQMEQFVSQGVFLSINQTTYALLECAAQNGAFKNPRGLA